MIARFKHHWYGEGGLKDILDVALPLIIGSSTITIMHFVDRKFLASYSVESFEAAAPAGMLSYLVGAFLMGVIVYINTFVSQYYGAGQNKRIGRVLWHGIYLACISALMMFPLSIFAPELFDLVGHSAKLRPHEVSYFSVLIQGQFFMYFNTALTTFFRGQKKTRHIMWARFLTVIINIPLDYAFIFGHWGAPEMGIKGAALATITSSAITSILLLLMIFRKENIIRFGLLDNLRIDFDLLKRIFRYGIPNGLQFLIELLSFSFFILMIGRIGENELAATNAAWSINSLFFMPMVGFGMAVSIIVGNAVGKKEIATAVRATRLTFFIVFAYMFAVAFIYWFFPRIPLLVLLGGMDPAAFEKIFSHAAIFLKLVALYSLFDVCEIVLCNAIKGAGDTKFVMWVTTLLSLFMVGIPSFLFTVVWPQSALVLWLFPTTFIICAGIIFAFRYKQGKWKQMRVIEEVISVPQ